MARSHVNDLTRGSLLSSLLAFALPILIGNLFQQLYNVTDTAVVSYVLGSDALAALGCTNSLYNVVLCIATGMTAGFSIVIARAYGSGDHALLRKTCACIVVLTIVLSVILSSVSLLFSRPMLFALHTPSELIADSLIYIRTYFAGILFTMSYNAIAGVLRGIGNSLYPLLFLIFSSVLNIGLDILFLTVFHTGILGAALATVIVQLVSVIASLWYVICCCPILHISRKDFHFDRTLVRELLTTGLAMGLMQSTVCFGTMMMQFAVNHLPTATIAGYTAARRLHSLLLAVLFAFGNTASTFAGQNLGAGNHKRVLSGVRCLVIFGLVWVTIVNILIFFGCETISVWMTGTQDAEVISAVSRYLRMDVPFYYGISILIILRYALQGMGGKLVAVAEGLMEMCGNILSAFFLVPALGYLGVCLCEPITCTLCALMILIAFIRHIRKPEYRQSASASA